MQAQGGEVWETGLVVRMGDEQEEKPGQQELSSGVRKQQRAGGDISNKDSSAEGQLPLRQKTHCLLPPEMGPAPGRESPEPAGGRGWGGKCLPCLHGGTGPETREDYGCSD